MTIHAYQEIYLSNAQATLGDAIDYAVNICNIPGEDFIKLFVVSSVSKRIENGEPAYLARKSGIEIVNYYQWYSGRRFREIFQAISFEDFQKMYYTLHEADISKFADIADARVREYFSETNLKRIRMLGSCTQAELAKRSGVGLRSIQMYEQRNKNINKASAETLYRLSKVLGCTMEDLIEK